MIESVFVDALINVSKNLAVLTCGVAAYCWIRRAPTDRVGWPKILAETFIFASLGTYSMVYAAVPQNGVILDARPLLIALVALFSGPVVAGPVTFWLILVRIWIGGIGTTPGVFEALMSLACASTYRDWLMQRQQIVRYVDLATVALLISIPATAAGLFLPWDVVATFMTPFNVTVLYGWNTIGLIVLGSLVMWDEKLKCLQRTLADDEARFRDVIDNLSVSLTVRNREGKVALVNRQYRELYGQDVMQFIGRDRSELRSHIFSGDELVASERDEKAVEATGRPTTRYTPDLMIRGEQRSILITTFCIPDSTGQPDSLAVISVDVSELRNQEREMERLQSHLVQAGKMEAIGQLAGGIAHDFNNLLGAIGGFASFLNEDLADWPREQLHAARILGLCERAKSLISQVLALARADRADRESIDVAQAIKETLSFLRATLPSTTSLDFNDPGGPLWLTANESQIRQLVINLSINCSQALEGKPGRIAIRLGRVSCAQAEAALAGTPSFNHHSVGVLIPGLSYVQIGVSDDGNGMDQPTLERLMEPFFAAMGSRDGAGLGLSIVHGIVLAYDGAYVVNSRADAGTSFDIFLPESEDVTEVTTMDAAMTA
jgi:PAS domain S-box-containing protein